MDIATAARLAGKPQGYDEPTIDVDKLSNSDPEVQKKLLYSDDLWKEAATAVPVEDAPVDSVNDDLSTDTPSTTDITGTTDTPVEPTETPEGSIVEPAQGDTKNPFESWGMSQEQYDDFVSSGIIRDGKIHSRFGPEDRAAFEINALHESKLRGIMGNELGEERKKNEDLQQQVEAQKEHNLIMLEAQNLQKELGTIDLKLQKSLRNLDVIYETPTYPGFDPVSSDQIRSIVTQQVLNDNALRTKFRRAKRDLPVTEEQLTELQEDGQAHLYDAFVDARDNYLKKQLEFLYTATEVENHYNEIKAASYIDSASNLYNDLQQEGLGLPQNDPRVLSLVGEVVDFMNKELIQAEREDRKPDPTYFAFHPVTGHAYVKPEAFGLYVRQNRKDVVKQVHMGEWVPKSDTPPTQTEPVESQTTDVWGDIVTTTREAFSRIKIPGLAGHLEISDDDELYTRALNFIQEKVKKDDPVYWTNGRLRSDAVYTYLQREEPSLIPGVIEDYTRAQYEQAYSQRLAEQVQKTQENLLQRHARSTDTLPTIASGTAQSQSGAQLPQITPEQYKNATFMVQLSKKLNMKPDELTSMYRARIDVLPDHQKSLYLDR